MPPCRPSLAPSPARCACQPQALRPRRPARRSLSTGAAAQRSLQRSPPFWTRTPRCRAGGRAREGSRASRPLPPLGWAWRETCRSSSACGRTSRCSRNRRLLAAPRSTPGCVTHVPCIETPLPSHAQAPGAARREICSADCDERRGRLWVPRPVETKLARASASHLGPLTRGASQHRSTPRAALHAPGRSPTPLKGVLASLVAESGSGRSFIVWDRLWDCRGPPCHPRPAR